MARAQNKLTDRTVKSLAAAGSYGDGGGLELQVTASGSRNWVLRYMLSGRRRQMGLGGYPAVSLAQAREKAKDARDLLKADVDPLAQKEAVKEAAREAEKAKKIEADKRRTFKQCASDYIADHEHGWKNAKLSKLWKSTMQTYAYPVFGDWAVGAVDTAAVMDVLRPLWLPENGEKPKLETASRVRIRIENILDWARVQGLREGENPARWRGHLEHLLPERAKIAKARHHAALPYADIGTFMADVRGREALAARALELTILTACRTQEVLGARWEEVALDDAVWTIPPERMKMDREHRVPLSTQAVDMLRKLAAEKTSETWVFPGGKPGKSLSNMAMLVLLDRMKRRDVTVHGFRSSFRDWASECTGFPHEVCEMALAHGIKNAAEAAYRRGDLFEKRARLMQDWADFCDQARADGGVVPLRSGVAKER